MIPVFTPKKDIAFCPNAFKQSSTPSGRPRLACSRMAREYCSRDVGPGVRKFTCVRAASRWVVFAASEEPSLQLATAKIPKDTNLKQFGNNLYNWASTLTTSGKNMPFSLPIKTQKLETGFQMSLLRISEGEPVAVGHLKAEVEDEPNVGNVLFVRFYEGEGSQLIRSTPLPSEPRKRLETVIAGLIDIPVVMGSMKKAIAQAVSQSR